MRCSLERRVTIPTCAHIKLGIGHLNDKSNDIYTTNPKPNQATDIPQNANQLWVFVRE